MAVLHNRRNLQLARHTAASALGAFLAVAACAAPAAAVPQWSGQFAGAGLSSSIFERGPFCLLAHNTEQGPRLFIGGEFTAIGGVPYGSIAAFDGVRWSAVNGIVSNIGHIQINSFSVLNVSGVPRVIVAGSFSAPGSLDGLGWLDGSNTLRSLPASPRRQAWFGGVFGWQSPAGPELLLSSGLFPQGSDYIYRYGDAGYTSMPPGIISVTNAYAVFDDGGGPTVYIGLPRVGANPQQTVSRWNGTTLSSLPAGGPGGVTSLCVHDDGTGPALYAGGSGIKRYRNGAWTSLPDPVIFNIASMVSFDDGSGPALYVGGLFPSVGGVPVNNIIRLRNGVWEPLGSGLAGGKVSALAVFDEDGPGPQPAALYAAGLFTTAGGLSSPGIARWGEPTLPRPCSLADLPIAGVPDGIVDGSDFIAFINSFTAGDPAADPLADVDHDGIIDGNDFVAFINAFAAGC